MIARFKIKGTCVDDLFHILASNGYQVQLSTTQTRDTYICDVIVKDFKSESEDK
ncbi:hypothetical protein CLOBY_27500 [Clostridium saccharobutylicum]|uniref:hypothetical protein n=1 Tax=Clostridium saccharobutylicum TaxID=169679 RepID=UPI000983E4EF|nr:hypothetical protein [Clostridium saccharobutylicum]AQS10605.1 hypothetical protein CLOBY_27500 [Clostridium saccharobutylicum]MBC2438042.1 hypothetical protein [Clostridium saccharobutylicum]NSB90505.1 uncharacterized protein (DUF2126 family) [Clostridium saccharobutylicum]NYC31560.1 uncharacterized protein (DUF2126 family) [Clostridium saccharobutylicum]OOM18878.1 hypothetical protein CLSAB_03360 [Clostridium saccharobutylicum]